MKKKLLLVALFIFTLTALTSCNCGILGTYYYKVKENVVSKLYLKANNKGYFINYSFDDNGNSIENIVNFNWEHTAVYLRDDKGEVLKDENDRILRQHMLRIEYYNILNNLRVMEFNIDENKLYGQYQFYDVQEYEYREYCR